MLFRSVPACAGQTQPLMMRLSTYSLRLRLPWIVGDMSCSWMGHPSISPPVSSRCCACSSGTRTGRSARMRSCHKSGVPNALVTVILSSNTSTSCVRRSSPIHPRPSTSTRSGVRGITLLRARWIRHIKTAEAANRCPRLSWARGLAVARADAVWEVGHYVKDCAHYRR